MVRWRWVSLASADEPEQSRMMSRFHTDTTPERARRPSELGRRIGVSLGWTAILISLGCAPTIVVSEGNSQAPPPARVAVLDFTGDDVSANGVAADGCGTALLARGVTMIERRQIETVLAEKSLSRSGEQSAEFYQRLGELAGVDAFIVGTVAGTRLLGQFMTTVLSARLINAADGSVMRLARFTHASGSGKEQFDLAQRVCDALLKTE